MSYNYAKLLLEHLKQHPRALLDLTPAIYKGWYVLGSRRLCPSNPNASEISTTQMSTRLKRAFRGALQRIFDEQKDASEEKQDICEELFPYLEEAISRHVPLVPLSEFDNENSVVSFLERYWLNLKCKDLDTDVQSMVGEMCNDPVEFSRQFRFFEKYEEAIERGEYKPEIITVGESHQSFPYSA